MSQYHEPKNELSQKTRDYTRALVSLKEEIEAVDWYQQRVDTEIDPELKAILEHNRNEEIEHAAMLLEWLRKNMPGWDKELKENLFTEGSIAGHEDDDEKAENKDLDVGKIK